MERGDGKGARMMVVVVVFVGLIVVVRLVIRDLQSEAADGRISARVL